MSISVRSVDVCNCSALRKATRHVTQFYDAMLRAARLNAAQYSLMKTLARQEGPTELWRLAEMLVMERSALARNLKLLERQGLVMVAVAATDLRRRQISLTADGHARLIVAKPAWEKAQMLFSGALGRDRSDALRELLADAKSANFAADGCHGHR